MSRIHSWSNVTSDAALLRNFLTGGSLEFLRPRNARVAPAPTTPNESISPFPLDVVIDREGRIAYISREYDADALRQVIEQLLEAG
jgi:hypothetical protein